MQVKLGSKGEKSQRTMLDVERHERIEAARKHAKLARRVFAGRFDPPVSYETVRQWESAESEPRPEKYDQIERITGVRASWIFSGTGPMLAGDEATSVEEVLALIKPMSEADRWRLIGEISALRSEPQPEPPKDRKH